MSRSICVLMLSTSVCVPYAAAQTVEPFVLDPITVEGADGTSVEADGGNGIGINADDLALQNPTDLQDLFQGEPTIAVGSSIPASQKLYVNGVEETNLAVTIDGARQNNRIFHHNATTLIDPALLKAVQIDAGVATADTGPGAVAGSVAYETKDVGDLLAEGDNFGGSFGTEIESNGEILSNSLTLFGRSGGFEAFGFLKYAEGDERADGSGYTIIGSGTSLLSGLGKLAYESDTGHRLAFSFENVQDDENRPFRANIGSFVGSEATVRNYDLQRQNYVLTYTDETPQGLWDPKISIAYSVTDLATPFSDTILDSATTESVNGVFQNKFALGLGSVTAGFDFYSDTASFEEVDLDDSANNYTAEESSSNIGAFAQARLDLTDTARVSFGARADFHELEGVDGSTFNDEGVSGNLSGEYDVTNAVTISAGYSNIWGGVALAENYIMAPGWTYPEDGIDPVTSENIFIATTANFGQWNVNAKIFRSDINDVRTAGFSTGPAVTSDVDTEGFEVGVGYAWTSGLLRIGYANIDTEINGETADSFGGNYLAMPVGEIITIQAQHSYEQIGLTVGASAEIALEETDTYDSFFEVPGSPLPAYEVVNAFAEYIPASAPTWVLRGEVSNIFDETYASRTTYGIDRADDTNALNEPGRSITISATKSF